MNEKPPPREQIFAFIKAHYLFDWALFVLVIWMIVWIIRMASTPGFNQPEWLLVPVTVIYSVFTLYIAAYTDRTARAMEASVQEMREARFAQFSAYFSLPRGYVYWEARGGTAEMVLSNLYAQPVIGLQAHLFLLEQATSGELSVKYSSLRQSRMTDISATTQEFILQLSKAELTEKEMQEFGDLALAEFKSRHKLPPKHSIFILSYFHRGAPAGQNFIWDLKLEEGEPPSVTAKQAQFTFKYPTPDPMIGSFLYPPNPLRGSAEPVWDDKDR